MVRLSAEEAKADLHRLVNEVDEPVLIGGPGANAVLMSEDAWRGMKETLYLVSIRNMKKSIIEGGKTPIDECHDGAAW
jgi:PHD/YefM family antitoxin component YafN of YafNO toxin-antitoxin module